MNCDVSRAGSRDLLTAAALLLFMLILLPGREAAGQIGDASGPQRQIQLGLGLLPGIDIQAGYVRPVSVITMEGVSAMNFSPRYGDGEGSLTVSIGLGGSLRLLGIADALTEESFAGYNADIGMRLGPTLDFFFHDDGAARTHDIRVLLDWFVRGSMPVLGRHLAFAELGMQIPLIRAGVWLNL